MNNLNLNFTQMSNVYSDPEYLGLEIIEALDEEGLGYEFNTLCVWKDKEGNLYFATDSGCSCPSPFEDYNSIDSLERITKANFDVFEKVVHEFPAKADESKSLIDKVKALIS